MEEQRDNDIDNGSDVEDFGIVQPAAVRMSTAIPAAPPPRHRGRRRAGSLLCSKVMRMRTCV